MNKEIFKEIGFTEGEVKVYFALLEHGKSKTGAISKYSGVHTSKVYLILDRLIEKGLVSYIVEANIKYFQPSDPERLIEYVNTKKRVLIEQEEELKKIIPEIKEKQKFAKYKQSASVYEGYKGIKALFEEMLDTWKKGEEYLVFAPGDEFKSKKINDYFKKHHLNRIEKGVIVKVIALDSQREFYKEEYKGIKNFEFKYSSLSLPAGVNIVGNKVSMLLGDPFPTAYVIQSELMAKRFREFFHNVWNVAKK
jgi:sugar-specific transcriptional regulator TrmB